MALDVKRLNSADRIDTSRAEAAGDRQRELNRMQAALLDEAVGHGSRRWFAVVVSPNAEKAVEKSVQDAGFEAWAPCRRVAMSAMWN